MKLHFHGLAAVAGGLEGLDGLADWEAMGDQVIQGNFARLHQLDGGEELFMKTKRAAQSDLLGRQRLHWHGHIPAEAQLNQDAARA